VINQLFTFPKTIERLRQGPLSEYLDAYAAALSQQGYRKDSISEQIFVISDLSRWLNRRHIHVRDLNSSVVDQFLRLRRRQKRFRRSDPRALRRLLAMLCQSGVLKQHQKPVADNSRLKIADEFRHYLLQERGLSVSTLQNYLSFIDQFLSEEYHGRTPNFAKLRALQVTGFVLRHAQRLALGGPS
jgi:site-specific recombinase XerD